MRLQNDAQHYGLIAILLHWVVAMTVIAMFSLGLWMTALTYYDSWYHRGPWLHKGVGVLLFLVVAVRIAWRQFSPAPELLSSHAGWESLLAKLVHYLLYLLLLMVMVSGYFISTADGRALPVFEWFELPALLLGVDQQAEIAGKIHFLLACTLLGVSALHMFAAFKHHFIDRDRTLLRMLGR